MWVHNIADGPPVLTKLATSSNKVFTAAADAAIAGIRVHLNVQITIHTTISVLSQ